MPFSHWRKWLKISGIARAVYSSGLLVLTSVSIPAQTQYLGDGVPTGLEEEIRWRVNRGRFDTRAENQYRGTSYSDVPSSSGPLAPNQSITLASRHHSEDMARNNVFQHDTIPGSAYYNPVTQPKPWNRMQAEGYTYTTAAENIAAGYGNAEAVYAGWWNSAGHRVNMYNSALREIGNGYYYWAQSTYDRYYTMDLGSTSGAYLFTDTLFRDSNTNGIYEQAEAVSNVAVRLLVGTVTHAYFDLSAPAGSFAIPIQTIANGATVQVVLSNTASSTVVMSIPRDYSNYFSLTLAGRQSAVYGTFVRPATLRNLSLRDVTPVTVAPTPPTLHLARTGNDMLLSWTTQSGAQYRPQWTTNFSSWSNLTSNPLTGTGSNQTYLDTGSISRGRRFYRLSVTQP